MERGPLHEIEDIKSSPPIMDSKRDSPMKSDDKENIPFEVTNKCFTRRSVLHSFDPLYSSPLCIKKKENEVDLNFAIAENYPTDELVITENDGDSTFTETEILHFTTAIESKSSDSGSLNLCEQHIDSDSTDSDLDFIDTEDSQECIADYILNILLTSVSETAEANSRMSETITVQEQEVSDLKLQLNQCQQVRATLELQLRQKEEIIIKTEAEFQRREAQYKQEIKQLKEKLDEKKEDVKDDEVKKLKDTVEKMKLQEKKLLDQLNKFTSNEDAFKQMMDEYEKTINQQLSETEKLKRENDTAKRHLATLELAFSDVHQKYERSKTIIVGYKSNEEAMQQSLFLSQETIKKYEEKYDSLKAHAKAQIDKSNKELNSARDKTQIEINKLTAIIKRLEIKNASLVNALEQKTNECTALAALCDEVTGHVE